MAMHFRSVDDNDNTRVPPLIVVGFYRSNNGSYRLGYLELLYNNGDFVVKKSKQSLSSYLEKCNPMMKIEHQLPLKQRALKSHLQTSKLRYALIQGYHPRRVSKQVNKVASYY